MNAPSVNAVSQAQVFADLKTLMVAVARSSIVLPLAVRLADWQTTRESADVDDVILAWIASHRPATPRHFDA
jgi:hypothetical protein